MVLVDSTDLDLGKNFLKNHKMLLLTSIIAIGSKFTAMQSPVVESLQRGYVAQPMGTPSGLA